MNEMFVRYVTLRAIYEMWKEKSRDIEQEYIQARVRYLRKVLGDKSYEKIRASHRQMLEDKVEVQYETLQRKAHSLEMTYIIEHWRLIRQCFGSSYNASRKEWCEMHNAANKQANH